VRLLDQFQLGLETLTLEASAPRRPSAGEGKGKSKRGSSTKSSGF
jgi:hypothetical protein